MKSDKHLIITWNEEAKKFDINATGNPTFVEAVGILELAKITLFSNQTALDKQEQEKEEKPKNAKKNPS